MWAWSSYSLHGAGVEGGEEGLQRRGRLNRSLEAGKAGVGGESIASPCVSASSPSRVVFGHRFGTRL